MNIVFKPVIDITEYLDENGNYTHEGTERLLRATEEEFRIFDSRKSQGRQSYHNMCRLINGVLRSDKPEIYIKIGQLIDSDDYKALSNLYYDLEMFGSSFTIYSTEVQNGISPTIYDIIGRIDDYMYIRLCVLYMFRRIQFDCPYIDYEGLFLELVGYHLSSTCTIHMIDELEFGDKRRVGLILADLYRTHGMSEDGETIERYICKNYEKIGNQKDYNMMGAESHVPIYAPHKLCFVTCVNNERMYEECMYYINRLYVPDNTVIDTVAVRDAENMTSGYNAAMQSSEADIYVYIHQDVCIINPFFLYEVLNIFQSDPAIGMIGLIGSKVLSPDGVMWHGVRIGNVYGVIPESTEGLKYDMPSSDKPHVTIPVEAVDGFVMITNRQIPWRSDLFDGWDFYDVSQSAEYIAHGYKVVVPDQTVPWAIHDDGTMNLFNYNKYRVRFLEEYRNN